ncbi:MAG: transposase [Planctomycetes bacterium]|nr:transposase [Planctomycetota bacterium]
MTKPRPNYSNQVVHAMNRRVDRQTLFYSDNDYKDFIDIFEDAVYRFDMRVLEWVLMPNHWHMLLWPERDKQLSFFIKFLAETHARHWRAKTDTVGQGAVYQGRYKAFPVGPGKHLNRLRNYLAMNPVMANLVEESIDWRWGTANRVKNIDVFHAIPLYDGPGAPPLDLKSLLTKPLALSELETKILANSMTKGTPYGNEQWIARIVEKLKLEHTNRKRGRPPKSK